MLAVRKVILASESGVVLQDNKPIFKAPDYIMGLAKYKDTLYFASRASVYRQDKDTGILHPKGSFHHIDIIDEELYVTATRLNEIWKFDLNLNISSKYVIAPPKPQKPIRAKEDGGRNYNHINKIFKHQNKFYVNLNWFEKQYGYSGVAVLDKNLQEIERFQYGWQSHGLCIIDDQKWVLCAVSGEKSEHPRKAGLMVDGVLVFEHDPKWFCKDFAVNDEYIVVVGGEINIRNKRAKSTGIVYILDRNYKQIATHKFPESGGFKGVMLLEKNYTRSSG